MAEKDHLRNPASLTFLGAAVDLVVATQSDTVNEPGGVSRGFILDATGTFEFITEKGSTVTMAGLLVGVFYPFRVKRVNATATTIADADIYLVY